MLSPTSAESSPPRAFESSLEASLSQRESNPGASRLLQIALVTIAMAAGSYSTAALSPLQETIKAGLQLSDNSISLVQGLAPALPMAVLSIPIGYFVDTRRRSRILWGLIWICAAGTVATAFGRSFPTLFAGRMLVGFGASGAVLAAVSMAADLSPQRWLGRVNMTLALGQTAGSALAFILGGQLLGSVHATGRGPSWAAVLLAMSAPLWLTVLLCAFLREPARRHVEAAEISGVGDVLRGVRRHLSLIVPLIIGCTNVSMADAAATIWAAPVLSRRFGLTPAEIGHVMGVVLLLGGTIGLALGGLLTDLAQRKAGARGVIWVAIAATAASAPCALFPVVSDVPTFGLLLAGLLIVAPGVGIPVTTLFGTVVPNELRAFSIGIVNSVGVLVSTGLAPSAVSLLSGAIGGPTHIAVALALVGGMTSLIGLLAFLFAPRALRHA